MRVEGWGLGLGVYALSLISKQVRSGFLPPSAFLSVRVSARVRVRVQG